MSKKQMTRLHLLLLLLLLLIVVNLFKISSSQSASNSTDELALLDFKNLITNADTTLNLNWTHNNNTHFCSWTGVTCSSQRQRVISLTLPSMNLQGIISPSLLNLSSLATLDLSNNSFHGGFLHLLLRSPNLRTISLGDNNLSDELSNDGDEGSKWNLPYLRILNLTSNNITGSLPRSITNATKLERLILSGNGIGGEIPVELGNMSNLVELDLSRNRLTGPIPPSLFNISSLRALFLSNNSLLGSFSLYEDHASLEMESIDLSANKLTGEIPSGLCRFAKLTSLSLSYNDLTRPIPANIGCLSRLESLYMTENRITGTIPPSLGNISSLQYLGCVSNFIGGRIPHELGNLPNLKMLGFDFNNLTGEIPPFIFNLSSLVYIAFTDNDLSGRIPATLGLNLPNLQGIFLAENRFEGKIPVTITNASMLTELELSYNLFTGTVPNNLGNLKQLIFLNLGGNRLSNEPGKLELGFLDSLVECRELQFVIVPNNPLRGTLPDSIQNLSSSIQMFNLENAEISGRIPSGIGNMSSMISLALNGNNITGSIPSEIGYLKQLQRIYLNNNMLQGHIPLDLCNLSNLGEVLLSENNLSGSIPPCIGSLPRLQKLMLGSNRLSSTLPVALWEMRNLLFMNVSKNMMRGELPSEIGMLQNVEGLDLSSNRFSSVIPTTVGQLQRLRFLLLSNNSFHGPIPASLENLISLETLDLSFNDLSGTIPTSLEGLSYLNEINLSYNHLEGAVPSGGIFANSSPRSFAGNKDLCGTGMPSLCRRNESSQRSKSQKHVKKIVIPVVLSVAVVTIFAISIWILLRRRTRAKSEDLEVPAVTARKGISYQEILRATDGFSEANLVGVGSSGSVFKGILPDATAIAVKLLSSTDDDDDEDDDESQSRFNAECQVLKQIRHRNLVKVITTCSNDALRAIVLEYMPNGSLDRWLHDKDKDCVLDLLQRIEIMLDVATAMDYLHNGYDFPVVHCDLKPANVLLDADMVAHVSDFGISKILVTNKHTTQTVTLGTIGYIAPEYGSEGTVSTAGDVYSYGIMLMEVVTRRRPTDKLLSGDLRQWVKAAYDHTSLMEVVDPNLVREINEACLGSLVELSLECTEEAPQQRINVKDVVVRLNKIKLHFLANKGI